MSNRFGNTIFEDCVILRRLRHFQIGQNLFKALTRVTFFYGGCVNGYKLVAKARPDESIQYFDFTSLYPYVNKTKRYPIKHPTIIREDFQDIHNYFGLIKCMSFPQLIFTILYYLFAYRVSCSSRYVSNVFQMIATCVCTRNSKGLFTGRLPRSK